MSSEPIINFQTWICPACHDDHSMENGCKKEIERLKKENGKLRKCVEFYGDEDNWKKKFDIVADNWNQFTIKDFDREQNCNFTIIGGKLARQTLRGIESE